MQFSEIVGLEGLKQRLIDAFLRGQVAHALLLSGNEGGGALAIARAYATLLTCQRPGPEGACGACPACAQNRKLVHPDVHYVFPLTAQDKQRELNLKTWRTFLQENPYPTRNAWAAALTADNKGLNISVAESRQIIRHLVLKAYMGPYKVLLIWLPEYMNSAAANALLKILEEPPEKTVFLLVSEAPDQLLPTILSRCQPLRVPDFSEAEVARFLVIYADADPAKAQQAAALSEGSLSEALRVVNQIQGDHQAWFVEWMRVCFKHDYTEMVRLTDEFQKMTKASQRGLMRYASTMFREALVWKLTDGAINRLTEDVADFVQKFAQVIHLQNIDALHQETENAMFYLDRNANTKILFLNLSIRLAKRLRPQ
ncbi:MAG: ATP-binding protein [Bernardetiaceae bacterium]